MEINQVTLPCHDYDASLEFYRTFGLKLIVDSPPRYARFETDAGSTLSIHAAEPTSPASNVVVYFEVADVDAIVRTLKAAGLSFDSGPVDQPWLWREAHIRDPAGNRLCIYRAGVNRRFPPWRVPAAP